LVCGRGCGALSEFDPQAQQAGRLLVAWWDGAGNLRKRGLRLLWCHVDPSSGFDRSGRGRMPPPSAGALFCGPHPPVAATSPKRSSPARTSSSRCAQARLPDLIDESIRPRTFRSGRASSQIRSTAKKERPMNNPETSQDVAVVVRLPRDLRDELKRRAAHEDRSVASLLRVAARAYLAQPERLP
jgi:hypothetical protein